VYYNMQAVTHGIADACRALSTPVISGNVSLYNETGGAAVYPTPVIGMLGILEDVTRYSGMGFADEGDEVFLLGSEVEQPVASLGGSEYLRMEHGLEGGRIKLDLALEERVQRVALATIRQGIATACHDCSDGGLAVALAEMCMAGSKGLDAGAAHLGPRLDATLFGEAQSRIIITMKPESRAALQTIVGALSVPIELIGRVAAADAGFRLGGVNLSLEELREAYEGGLPAMLARTPPTALGEVL
jgi:phosphoribosylformylglycinamidine synthase